MDSEPVHRQPHRAGGSCGGLPAAGAAPRVRDSWHARGQVLALASVRSGSKPGSAAVGLGPWPPLSLGVSVSSSVKLGLQWLLGLSGLCRLKIICIRHLARLLTNEHSINDVSITRLPQPPHLHTVLSVMGLEQVTVPGTGLATQGVLSTHRPSPRGRKALTGFSDAAAHGQRGRLGQISGTETASSC